MSGVGAVVLDVSVGFSMCVCVGFRALWIYANEEIEVQGGGWGSEVPSVRWLAPATWHLHSVFRPALPCPWSLGSSDAGQWPGELERSIWGEGRALVSRAGGAGHRALCWGSRQQALASE